MRTQWASIEALDASLKCQNGWIAERIEEGRLRN